MELDETDIEILTQLDEHGEVDANELAEELGVSTSTVYYRIETYRENGLFDGRVAELDPQVLGFELTAVTQIQSDYGDAYDDVGEKLADISGVQQVHQMLGEVSFLVISQVRGHEELQQLIDRIIDMDGVVDSSTNVVLRTVKQESRLLVNYDDEALQALLD
ncbi:Lrp/AsnC family transcriptional regulator [Haloarchaeobius sp. HME9146]|uniref:Lrp/AsnC family transcriptional regulator n=1 Tax=Haloarchaeobius sp. HME9146 TaxID=2978732 RepID=UPI0021C1F1EC|nr:Lrp/AsnC family transcriptional regulator [Haloarchaeobius sp. HME9146]MCT9095054.1 Lrp/AsnC family transcriptional regulator [Haloarchaeobius sp. HME9146]